MTDLKILEQLLNGYHLEPLELIRAKQIIAKLENEVNNRKI